MIFILAIGFSVTVTGLVSYLVAERVTGHRHFQEVSGMKISAYWIANFIVDWVKLQPTVLVTVACFLVLPLQMESAYITILLFPIGVIPFTYVTTFMFSN